jgi:hypothetical protein
MRGGAGGMRGGAGRNARQEFAAGGRRNGKERELPPAAPVTFGTPVTFAPNDVDRLVEPAMARRLLVTLLCCGYRQNIVAGSWG